MDKRYQWLKDNWSRLLIWGYSAFIMFIALTPFQFARDPHRIIKNFHRIEWVPYILKGDFYSGS
ncbi:MAG: hypothetical protein D6681_17825, partial [Calditrichaeota bacterium]